MSSNNSVTCTSSKSTCAETAPPVSSRLSLSSGSRLVSRARMLDTSAAKRSSFTSLSVAPIAINAWAVPSESFVTKDEPKRSTAFQMLGGTRPTMPKSMKPTRPSLSTRRLPAWTSAWKISQFLTDSAQTFSAEIRVASGFALYPRIPSKSVRGTPLKRSMTKTCSDDTSLKGLGAAAMDVRSFATRNSRKVSKFWSSNLKSSSPSMERRISSTRSTSEDLARAGLRKPSTRAEMYKKPRSA
mmetsp:Transcript_12576/g.33790  ORF Transcript_12576/g.33790 Transcript_12576/m.33790 type:complete len:242 (-) Transcript_12576:876-1601(-)